MFDFNKPNIEITEISEDKKYGRFVVEPLERGYGTTLGNSLRRIMLSSLPGAAISQVKIDGVLHEFSSIPGVKEDVTEIVMNLKSLAIKNTSETDESNISLQEYSTSLKELQYRLVYADGIDDKKPKILKPKQVLYENPTTVAFDSESEKGKFYVYGLGQMLGLYDKAGYAVQKADEVSGVVVSSDQAYVWERGNRDLRYEVEMEGFTVQEGESTFVACIRQILALEGKNVNVAEEMNAGKPAIDILSEYSGGEGMDLTGCTTEEMLYIIGRGTPVIAMTDSSNAVLLIGYDTSTVTYIDPADGAVRTSTAEEIDSMVAGSGHTFIGYVK